MIEIKDYNASTHRLTLEVGHRTSGRKGTHLTSALEIHLSPNATEAADRISVLSLDLHWVRAATLPQLGAELARVLERIVAGLREGPGPLLALLEVPPPPAPPAPPAPAAPPAQDDLDVDPRPLEARLAELDALRRDELVGALRLAPCTSWEDALEQARDERDVASLFHGKMVDALGLPSGISWEGVLEEVRALHASCLEYEAHLGIRKGGPRQPQWLTSLCRDQLASAMDMAPGSSWKDALEEVRLTRLRFVQIEAEMDARRCEMLMAMGLPSTTPWAKALRVAADRSRLSAPLEPPGAPPLDPAREPRMQEEKSGFDKAMEQARLGLAKASDDCPCGSHDRSRACCARPCSALATPHDRKAAYVLDLEKRGSRP